MEFSYKKNDNHKLFNALVENNLLQVSQCQNYIPLYEKFFTINATNYNSINLNNKYSLHSIKSKETDNIFNGVVINQATGLKEKKDIFFKFGPLLDPIKYLIGKYDMSNVDLLNLPKYAGDTHLLHLPKPPSLDNTTAIANSACSRGQGGSAPSAIADKITGGIAHPLPLPLPATASAIADQNNSAYVDGFFTYLTSQILNVHGFKHGIDFYGSFLALKNNFAIDVCDDIDYMSESEFFNKNKDILYTIDESQASQFVNNDTRNCKPKLKLDLSTNNNDIEGVEILELSDIDTIYNDNNVLSNADIVYETTDKEKEKTNKKDDSRSTCSSRFSDTDDDDEGSDAEYEGSDAEDAGSDADCERSHADADAEGTNTEDKNNNDTAGDDTADESDTEDDTSSNMSDDQLFVKIKTFPVQVISLECCEGTLDSLVENDDITDEMWDSIVLQILMTLIAYQQCFHLTHNDLHSNNIMYMKTSEPFLYYKVDEKYYKVPTFGRIFKIIDFGRAIYKFRGNLMCSDSYNKTGDAAGLYNIEPYFNTKKPRLEPNYSFDLCRLGCSLFDAIVDDISEAEDIESPILKIITDWCKDDKGKNIMYKMNGEERYPDFKLYKMIARLVHHHTPLNVLRNKHFSKYSVNKKTMKNIKDKKVEIMDIDDLPCYV